MVIASYVRGICAIFLGNQSRNLSPGGFEVSSAIGCAAASVWFLGCDNSFFFSHPSSSSFLFASISGPCTHNTWPHKCRRLGTRQGGTEDLSGLASYRASLPGTIMIYHIVSAFLPWLGTMQARRLAGWAWARPLLLLG